MTFRVPNKFRVRSGRLGSDDSIGNCGAFVLKLNHGQQLNIIASDGAGWEHVSVSRNDRCPTWEEMCKVKDVFWDEYDCVVQYHPAKSEYVNNHPFCLHLWREVGREFPVPESILVGVK
jgi:hypothetical protein